MIHPLTECETSEMRIRYLAGSSEHTPCEVWNELMDMLELTDVSDEEVNAALKSVWGVE